MPIADSGNFQTIAFVTLSMLCAYGSGRVHQWHMHSMDRDRAFREGYSNGYRALFHLAARGAWPPARTGKHDEPASNDANSSHS